MRMEMVWRISLALLLIVVSTGLASCRSGRSGPQAAAEPAGGPDFRVEPAEREELVSAVLAELDAKYVFPEIAAKNRPELAKRWSDDSMKAMTSGNAIMQRVNADLAALFHDKHVSLMPRSAIPEAMLHEEAEPTAADLERMAKFEASHGFGIERAEILPGNVGYLVLHHFPYVKVPGMEQAARDAMASIADSSALIVDLRHNGGGDGDTVALFLSYLLDRKTLLAESYDRLSGKTVQEWTREEVSGKRYGASRPVFVLTSRRTFSAGEGFSYAVQTLKRGTIVGETTGGGGHYNALAKVGKQFVLSVAIGYSKSPVTNTNWDGVGVKPDVEAEADRALDVATELARKATSGDAEKF